jgi:hypothetical protein
VSGPPEAVCVAVCIPRNWCNNDRLRRKETPGPAVNRPLGLCWTRPGVATQSHYQYRLSHMQAYCQLVSLVQFDRPPSEFLATHPENRVRFPGLPHFLRSSGSGTGSTHPRDYN